jgi:hypothetical protein
MSKVVFIDEQYFDHDEYDGYDEYEGFSELDVYDIPGFDEEGDYDEEEDEYNEWDRDEHNNVGTVLVGFDSYGDATILEVLDGDPDLEDAELYYPPL